MRGNTVTASPASNSAPEHASQGEEELMDTALHWYLRLKDASATGQDHHAFQIWLALSPRHAAAYQSAIQLWEDIEAPAQLLYQQHQRSCRSSPHRTKRPMRWGWGWGWGWATAALLMLSMLVSAELWRDPARLDRWMADIATSPGQVQRTVLEDGSTLLLDGNSAIDITIDATRREVSLHRGRLWMDAAKQQQPLLINAGDASILVLGTHFAVSRSSSRITVTVEEGEVTVRDALDRQTLVSAGQQLIVYHGELGIIEEIDPLLAFAWKEGHIIFDQASIEDLVEQLERMRPGRILFDAQAFAGLSFSGSFPANQPNMLIDTLVDLSMMEAHYLPGEILWLRSANTG